MPLDFKCIITDYKLLGLIEGDGSFIVNTLDLTPKLEIELTARQKLLLMAIKEFLFNYFLSLGLSIDQLEKSIRIYDLKPKGKSKK